MPIVRQALSSVRYPLVRFVLAQCLSCFSTRRAALSGHYQRGSGNSMANKSGGPHSLFIESSYVVPECSRSTWRRFGAMDTRTRDTVGTLGNRLLIAQRGTTESTYTAHQMAKISPGETVLDFFNKSRDKISAPCLRFTVVSQAACLCWGLKLGNDYWGIDGRIRI